MVAKPPLVPHYYNEGQTRYILSLPDVYASEGSTIASALGLTKAPANFEPDDDDVGLSVSEGLRTAKLVRLRISYRDTVGGRTVTKSSRIVCPVQRVDTAIASLKTKNYKGKNVTGAGVPRRRRLT